MKRLEGVFDIIYLDAHKGEYIEYLNIILNRGLLATNGIIMADDGQFVYLRLYMYLT